jgi:hypothetical protein
MDVHRALNIERPWPDDVVGGGRDFDEPGALSCRRRQVAMRSGVREGYARNGEGDQETGERGEND